MPSQSRIQYIAQRAQALGLDPQAVLAIAGHEGLSGGIGDGGHAFGPFQMNNAGGVLTGKFQGMSPQQINQWAWSNQGIDSALGQIAGVARGLKGAQAIQAITTRFERPVNPQAEIADALAHYGKVGGGGALTAPGEAQPMIGAGGAPNRQALMSLLLSGAGRVDFGSNQVQPPNLIALAQARQGLMGASGGSSAPAPAPATGGITPAAGVRFLGDTTGVNSSFLSKVGAAARAAGATQIRVTSGFRSPEHNAAVGGVSHSNHTLGHALDGEAYIPGKGWVPLGVALQPVVGKFGLRSGNQPGFFNGGTDPVHVDDGFNLSH